MRGEAKDWKSQSAGDVRSLMGCPVETKSGCLTQGPPLTQGHPLTQIESLDLSVTELFGWGLQFVGELRHLRALNLFSTKVSDEALVHLADSLVVA